LAAKRSCAGKEEPGVVGRRGRRAGRAFAFVRGQVVRGS